MFCTKKLPQGTVANESRNWETSNRCRFAVNSLSLAATASETDASADSCNWIALQSARNVPTRCWCCWWCWCCSRRLRASTRRYVITTSPWHRSSATDKYTDFYGVFKFILMWHIAIMLWFSVRVFRWLMTCALGIFSVLNNFCQIAPLHSNAVWMTRVLHLKYAKHTHRSTTIW